MSRGHIKTKKHELNPDPKFDSILVAKFINYIMKNGKRSVAEKIAIEALEKAGETVKTQPLEMFAQVLKNVGPLVEVKSKRIGGANYQVPVEVGKDRRNTLAMRWVLDAARGQKGKKMSVKLSSEMVSAFLAKVQQLKRNKILTEWLRPIKLLLTLQDSNKNLALSKVEWTHFK